MAASINHFAPVTPPPENQSFTVKPMSPTSPFLMAKGGMEHASLPTPTDFADSTRIPLPQSQSQPHPQPQTQATFTPAAAGANGQASASAQPGANLGLDPSQLAMVSRIAAYYQHRCLAVTNFQQQRCQAWANMHRQKCQETMQAAMLVVAWYVRDRIQRRRRKQKTKFRSALHELQGKPKITRGEVVRRWVLQVPEKTLPHDSVPMDRARDRQEAHFDMDAEVPPERDCKLFEMADNLIKSQYKKIEVPLLGVLNFDESDSESESVKQSSLPDDEEDEEMPDGGSLGDDQDEEFEDDDDDDDLYDDEDPEMDEVIEGEPVSDMAHDGTESRKQIASSTM
jgi:hypothetical protein